MDTMNRTQSLISAFGWQGGTIHQIAYATGCSVQELLNSEAPVEQKANINSSYSHGWFAGRTNVVEFNVARLFPKYQGDINFWVGVADGLMKRYNTGV